MEEKQNYERKIKWDDKYIEWIVGFANANGGIIDIGIADNGEIVGLENAKDLLEKLPNKIRDKIGIIPDINLEEEDGKSFIKIVVEPYQHPVSYNGHYFYRSGSTKQELKGKALDHFLLSKFGKNWDDVPLPDITIDDLSPIAFEYFRDGALRSNRVSSEILEDDHQVLIENLRLYDQGHLKRAAYLLFGKDPESMINGSYIKIGYFESDDELLYFDEIHGSLFVQAEKAYDLLITKYLKAYINYEGIHRHEKYLFPKEALREALLNAIVHKDYSSSVPIQISVYPDKLYIWNPGQLPDKWTLDSLRQKHPSIPFNPSIATAFFRSGYIESWGRGIHKIIKECIQYGIKSPVYNLEMSGLMVEFYANQDHITDEIVPKTGEKKTREKEKTGEKTSKKTRNETRKKTDSGSSETGTISKNEAVSQQESREGGTRKKTRKKGTREKTDIKIIELLKEKPDLTINELSEIIGISEKGIEWQIDKLKTTGKLTRVGSRKHGYWQVKEQKND
ncbi:MAG: ATP-binding protein [Candidatus Zixiibacteriota bacterium]